MMDQYQKAIAWVRRHVFLRRDYLSTSEGAVDEGRPILTDAGGQVDATLLNAGDVLAKLLTVDGAGSGLDADTLDGVQGSSYLQSSAYTAADVLSKLLTVDGAGSGLDADTLDGAHGSAYALLSGAAFTGNSSVTGTFTVTENGALFLLVGTNHSYISFYPDGVGAGRKAYLGFGSSLNDHFSIMNEASALLQFGTAGSTRLTIDSAGYAGFGTTSPSGILHAYDGTGSHMHKTVTGVVGSEAELIANGTGDVSAFVCFMAVAKGSSGTYMGDHLTLQTPGAGSVTTALSATVEFKLYSTGQLVVSRIAGAETWSVSILALWL